MPGLLSGTPAEEKAILVHEAPVTDASAEAAAGTAPEARGDEAGDTTPGGRSLRGRRNRRRRGGRNRDAQGQLLPGAPDAEEAEEVGEALDPIEAARLETEAETTADDQGMPALAASPSTAPVDAAVIQAAMNTPAGRPRPAPVAAAPREETVAPVATPPAAPVVVARATEVGGEYMPRLVTSADGVVDAPQRIESSPLTPSAPKDFTPRLLASGDGAPTSLPVVGAPSPGTAAAPVGDFMPRLIVSGREESRSRREPRPAAPAQVETPAAESGLPPAAVAAEEQVLAEAASVSSTEESKTAG